VCIVCSYIDQVIHLYSLPYLDTCVGTCFVQVRKSSLSQVLNAEAYMLFYKKGVALAKLTRDDGCSGSTLPVISKCFFSGFGCLCLSKSFLNCTNKIAHSEMQLHYLNKDIFSDCPNLFYDKAASFRCDGRLFHRLVRVQQLQMLRRRRCCMSSSQRMFGSLWNVVVAHEHRRQDVYLVCHVH